jgi:methionyl-tRNA synthetase
MAHSRPDLATILRGVDRPVRAVVTAGMPYANGPLHLGHLAGAHVPADIHARWLGLLIGRENVLYVCGTDDHGSTSEFMAMNAQRDVSSIIAEVHDQQAETLARYAIGLDTYSGTSRPETLLRHTALCQDMLRRLHANGLLAKRVTQQWYDPKVNRFLSDRLVRGKCPNPKCDNEDAYSHECEKCGHQHDPRELGNPRSTVSDATPELRDSAHLFLDMWPVSDVLKTWVASKTGTWRQLVIQQVMDTLRPSLRFAREHEATYKTLDGLPTHKRKYAAGGQVVLQFESKPDLAAGKAALHAAGIAAEIVDDWAKRSITRDTKWGVPIPADLDPELAGKTLYVWPDSLIAPISFSKVALEQSGRDPEQHAAFWCDPSARVYQFIGQDNIYFYVLMQGAMWLGSQADPNRMPVSGERQMTDVLAVFHLLVNGEKMSKSKGNFILAQDLLDRYAPDQIRYHLAHLGLADKPSSFDFVKLDERCAFLATRMNSAFERPIAAAVSKFDGKIPAGELIENAEELTTKMVGRFVTAMERATYPSMLNELENYARTINSLLSKHKPYDDRLPEGPRRDALFTAFYLLKNLVIMLYPFVPSTMDRVRASLRLPPAVFSVEQLGTPIAAGHEVGPVGQYFPPAGDDVARASSSPA